MKTQGPRLTRLSARIYFAVHKAVLMDFLVQNFKHIFPILLVQPHTNKKLNDCLAAISSVQLLSCPTLGDPMDCSMPAFPVHHQLLELAQTHVHRVGDAIQPSYPLSSPSPPAFNLAQHQGLV